MSTQAADEGRSGEATADGSSPDRSPRRRLSRAERREVIERAATEAFAEHGYDAASMDAIAAAAGVSAPVLYDHFASKRDLHARLLERTRDELLATWRGALAGGEPQGVRIPRAIDAWARYVEAHPYAARMFFREATGDPEAAAFHEEIQASGRRALAAILAAEPGAESLAGADAEMLEMAAEIIRSGLTGLAVWWLHNPHVPRERIVAAGVNVLWSGLERAGG